MFYIEPKAVDPIGLPEMVDFVKSMGRWDTDEKIADSVEPLRRLGASGRDLMKSLAYDLLDGVLSGRVSDSVTNSFILFSENGVSIRMNFWRPLSERSKLNKYNGRIYAYGFPHDHDFDLLTVGAFGPGYTTTIFEHAAPEGEIQVGDKVNTRSLGDFTLAEGAVLFYEQSRDIHIQHPSPAFSASLNLLASQRVPQRAGQFVFDDDCQNIIGIPEYRGSRLLRVVEGLLEVDEDAIDLIKELVRHYRDEFVERNIVRLVSARNGMPFEDTARMLGVEPRLAATLRPGGVFDVGAAVLNV